MRVVLASLLILGLLFCSAQVSAQASAKEVPDVKGARHVILPYVGYQMTNGEKTGFTYSDRYFDFVTSGFAVVDTSKSSERDESSPELGLTYRYLATNLLSVELSFSTLENKVVTDYPIIYNASFYTQRSKVSISKGNTLKLAGGVLVNVPCPISWLRPTGRLGFGYAWRDVKIKSARASETVNFIDASDMYVLQGGVDVSVWSQKDMLIEGTLFYTQFIPTDSAIDPFGGLGWGIRVFPIWSSQRREGFQ